VSSRNRKSLSVLRLGPRVPVSSASLEAWDAALQASITPLQASSASLQASTVPLEARSGSLEASGSRSETSNRLIQAWTSVSELPDPAHRRSSASFEAWNASLQASSCALEVRFPSGLVTGGTLQVRARPPALLGTNCPRTLAAHTLSASPTKATNARPTTGGFHMHGVHACELPQIPNLSQREKRVVLPKTSTEFLYPSPICIHPTYTVLIFTNSRMP
jgi:hypothetical protein